MLSYILCTLLLINVLTTGEGAVGNRCSDHPKAKLCHRLQKIGECNSKISYLRNYVTTYCPETCSLCKRRNAFGGNA
ncbi:hypothetical protein GCK32_012555 [Trichostrongylus colubriformis]|uniref:ShKT domain-containing protein n=1 Tax=Trichostrongylus colubriformis TaxID=6319 RepID=A0AAN8F659_TRICO